MGLQVFYPEDIENAIRAAEQATTAALRDADRKYLEGYRAALLTIALAFGLGPRQQIDPLPAWYPVALNRGR